jgi:cell division protein FtsQ
VARKSVSSALQDELYPSGPSEYASERVAPARDPGDREPFDDSRVVDLEAEEESPFLRGQKRVSARRGSLPKKTANRLKWTALALVVLTVLAAFGVVLYRYGKHSWRFRIDSSDQIEISGAQHISHAEIMEVLGGDIGRNIFFIPLSQRKQQLEQIPWVESASVMRFVPNRLRVEIHERTPVAFARIGAHISLIDAGGNLMELTPGGRHKYSFPVIAGMNGGEALSTRAVRMKNYNDLMQQLDSSGAHYSQEISEVDLSDTDDVKVLTADPDGEVLVHLGSGNYLQRYKIYVTHVQAWRQQFAKLDSVDLRYDGQIILNPDLEGIVRQPALTQAAAKAALAAGAKNGAIVNYEKFVAHPAPTTATKPAVKSKIAAKAESPKTEVKSGARAEIKDGAKGERPTGAKSAPAAESAKVESKTAKATPKVVAHQIRAKGKAKVKAKAMASRSKTTPAKPLPAAAAKPTTVAHVPPGASTADKIAKPTPAASATTATALKKPSPAIPKETPQN